MRLYQDTHMRHCSLVCHHDLKVIFGWVEGEGREKRKEKGKEMKKSGERKYFLSSVFGYKEEEKGKIFDVF